MRCPKCGFISYDILEKCVKCGKNIEKSATELEGTVAGVPAPAFLQFAGGGAASEAPEGSAGVETEEPLDFGVEGEEEVEMDFSLEEESAEAGGEMEVDLGETEAADVTMDLEEEAQEEEPEIDLGVEEAAAEEEEIGISDLAPSEEEQAEGAFEEQFEVEEETEASGAGAGLEDLKVEGIDLETAPDAEAEPDKITPSVKTGTALDDFDIDLGDLLTSKKD